MGVLNTDQDTAATEVATRMADAASAWLTALKPDQRAVVTRPAPGAGTESEAERQRWFYTPTDHGGLALGAQTPAQQRLAHQLVASGLSAAGYVTVATIIGLENVLDHAEGWVANWERERGRDPELYYLRVFGEPGGPEPWGWRFGGHHISLNYTVIEGRVTSCTPSFIGAHPATTGLIADGTLAPLGHLESTARQLALSLTRASCSAAELVVRKRRNSNSARPCGNWLRIAPTSRVTSLKY